MRVPYTSRRKRSITTRTNAPTIPVVKELPAPVEEKEDDDFDFYPMDDMDDECKSESQQSTALYPIAEQTTDVALAVSILEDFFFGGGTNNNATPKRVDATPESTYSPTSSPTSTLLHPVCSCPHMGHRHFSTESFTTSSSPRLPKRPSLKQCRPRSNSDLTSSKRNVSFTEISVREYDVELSDHPSCSYGPPIQLGWDYQETHKTSVEDYEVTRSPHRREVHELVLSYNTRRRRLKQSGYRKSDLKRAQQEVERIKRERLITEFFLPAMAIDETLEKVAEKVKGWFRRPPQRQQCEGACQIHSSPPMGWV